jgi:hypothetical protein
MAVKTAIWVAAHLRRCFGQGLTGVVARRGAPEAGSVFVRVTLRDGGINFYGPAPGPAFDEHGRRRFHRRASVTMEESRVVDAMLAREVRFDPDIWILDIDDPAGGGLLDTDQSDTGDQNPLG